MVRTSLFQGEDTGSTPVGAIKTFGEEVRDEKNKFEFMGNLKLCLKRH